MNEANADWVERELLAVLERHPFDEVEKSMRFILLSLAIEFGLDILGPTFQVAVATTLLPLQLDSDASDDSKAKVILEYAQTLYFNKALINDITAVFSSHQAALTHSHANNFLKGVGRLIENVAPRSSEPAPEGTVTLDRIVPKRRV